MSGPRPRSHLATRCLSGSPAPIIRRPPSTIAGQVPSPADPPPGCRFHPRCPLARTPGVCVDEAPALRPRDRGPSHLAACHFSHDVASFTRPID
jgi:oligopeptide/dipeptide ABC transporter ATP-binding protein